MCPEVIVVCGGVLKARGPEQMRRLVSTWLAGQLASGMIEAEALQMTMCLEFIPCLSNYFLLKDQGSRFKDLSLILGALLSETACIRHDFFLV